MPVVAWSLCICRAWMLGMLLRQPYPLAHIISYRSCKHSRSVGRATLASAKFECQTQKARCRLHNVCRGYCHPLRPAGQPSGLHPCSAMAHCSPPVQVASMAAITAIAALGHMSACEPVRQASQLLPTGACQPQKHTHVQKHSAPWRWHHACSAHTGAAAAPQALYLRSGCLNHHLHLLSLQTQQWPTSHMDAAS